MRLDAAPETFESFLTDATTFWRNNVPAGGEGCVLVETLHQDVRVAVRTLTVANAIRRVEPAGLVALTGTDRWWSEALWSTFDTEAMGQFCTAYGASEVLDLHAMVDAALAGTDEGGDASPGRPTPGSWGSDVGPIDATVLERNVVATACRLARVPRLTAEEAASERYRDIEARTRAMTRLYDDIFRRYRPIAFVTSHVDYNQWGLGVDSALRFGVPVVHVQSTGSLKAYTLFPERARGEATLRAELTRQIGAYFESYVWPRRDRLQRSSELVAWRSKGNLGRPSWWRGGDVASMDLITSAERRDLRRQVARRIGFDPAKPVVAVFNHAVSDALGTNVEVFADLAEWFEATAAYAASESDVNWVFLDHPSQTLYDVTDFFGRVADRYAGHAHLRFQQHGRLSKNALWSLLDLGLTVRGSVSNELPAYGIPVIQAGWSEWSDCGVSTVARDQADYWALVQAAIRTLCAGEPLVTDEQVRRARLWAWFYRSLTDVVTPLVPHWEAGSADALLLTIQLALRQVESDFDPAFAAAARQWATREPFLTRVGLGAAARPDDLRAALPA